MVRRVYSTGGKGRKADENGRRWILWLKERLNETKQNRELEEILNETKNETEQTLREVKDLSNGGPAH